MIHIDKGVVTPLRDIPRFFDEGKAPATVKAVVETPLVLDGRPFDYYTYSPTPFDPLLLRDSTGPLYDEAALRYMDERRVRLAPDIMSPEEGVAWYEAHHEWLPNPTWLSVLHEMRVQHELKVRRNDRAVRMLRNIEQEITPEHAEELMQVRAGIASLSTILQTLVRYPEIGGLEWLKATCPLDPQTARAARIAGMGAMHLMDDPNIALTFTSEKPRRLTIVPDPELDDTPDPRIVVMKTVIARAAVTLAEKTTAVDMVWRDSGVLLNPAHDDLSVAYMTGRSAAGDAIVHAAPIAVTGYARLSSR